MTGLIIAGYSDVIYLSSDHAGINLRGRLVRHLALSGYKVRDLGPTACESVDYPDFGAKLAEALRDDPSARGIAICGSGIGIGIAANKISGVRAATVHDVTSAHLAREHNNANIICFGERLIGPEIARESLVAFLNAEFQGGRHAERVLKISDLES